MIHSGHIEDFIYLQFQKDGPLRFPAYFSSTLASLRKVYPHARLHLLTNVDEEVPGFFVHHRPGLPADHLSRFEVFGLLDRPAMYLDQDVVVQRPFTSWHLEGTQPFKFFTSVERRADVFPVSSGAADFHRIYNGGVVWIRRPDSEIVGELYVVARECFASWPYPNHWALDDVTVSYYCLLNGHRFEDVPNVNRLVYGPYGPDPKAQSLHFIGKDKSRIISYLETSCF